MNISKTFTKFCLKNALVLSTIFALFMSFNAAADTGSFFNMKDHQSWISGLFRIKISFDEPFTLTFRLRGFTSAFNRAITLMTPDEEKYF